MLSEILDSCTKSVFFIFVASLHPKKRIVRHSTYYGITLRKIKDRKLPRPFKINPRFTPNGFCFMSDDRVEKRALLRLLSDIKRCCPELQFKHRNDLKNFAHWFFKMSTACLDLILLFEICNHTNPHCRSTQRFSKRRWKFLKFVFTCKRFSWSYVDGGREMAPPLAWTSLANR